MQLGLGLDQQSEVLCGLRLSLFEHLSVVLLIPRTLDRHQLRVSKLLDDGVFLEQQCLQVVYLRLKILVLMS